MDIRQLKYFVFVADLRSIAQASAHLGIAAPAISRSISTLEEDLRTPLFERDGRGMQLTSAGQLLYAKASQILQDLEIVRQEVMTEGRLLAGDVTIGATPSVIAMVGTEVVKWCETHLPRIRLKWVEGYSAYLESWVLTGAADLALVNGLEPGSPRLQCECLAVERLFALGSRDAFAASGDLSGSSVTLASILGSPLLLPSTRNPIRVLIDRAAADLGLSVPVMAEIDSVGLLKDLLREGPARGVLPFGAAKQEIEAGLLMAQPIVEPEIRCNLNLLYLAERPPTRGAVQVLEAVIATLKELSIGDQRHGFVEILGRAKPGRRAAGVP